MKKPNFYYLVPLLLLVMGIGACEDTADLENVNQSPTYFNSLSRNGSASVTTDVLILSFSSAINGLNRNDIHLSGPAASGVVKGDLVHVSGGTYRLPVNGITSSGQITVTLSTRLNVTPGTRSVSVFFSGSPNNNEKTLYIFNLSVFLNTLPSLTDRYDYFKLTTALQGLVNRDAPRIYFYYEDPSYIYSAGNNTVDRFWLNHLSTGGRYLSTFTRNETKYPANAAGFLNLVKDFSDYYEGFVIWDTAVPATANVASTIAGADNLLPVPGNTSLYTYLMGVNSSGGFPLSSIRVNLVNKFTGTGTIPDSTTPSTNSKKNDAYIWAKEQYLDTGKTNPLRMAYCTDSYIRGNSLLFETTLANADFHIKEKAFFWDLSPDAGRLPQDDRTQPLGTDVATMNKLLASQAAQANYQIFNVSGFVPWNYKYTEASDPGQSTLEAGMAEWTLVARLSSYGGQKEADANVGVGDVSNLSVLSYVPLNVEFKQKNDKGASSDVVYDPDIHYCMVYMGDYDSASWTSGILSNLWENSKSERGKHPLAWPIAGGIKNRIPHLYNYIYENATANDFFVAGNNGTAYLTASAFEPELRPAGIPDLLPVWEEYNIFHNNLFDIDILGWCLNGSREYLSTERLSSRLRASMSRMFPVGVSCWTERSREEFLYYEVNPDNGKVTPFIHWAQIGFVNSTAAQLAQNIYNTINTVNGAQREQRFHNLCSVLIPPAVMNEALDLLAEMPNMNYKIVDPYTLFRLAREARD